MAKSKSTSGSSQNNAHAAKEPATRRDFLVLTASSMAAVGAGVVAWPLISSLNPAADTLALSSTEVDLSPIQPGQIITVMWRGKPVFIRRRTDKEIAEAREVKVSDLPDPQKDEERVQKGKEQWLIVVGVCTHLGCVPLGNQGDYGGWFCPCHGSHYDTSGRIRKGPAPANLHVPDYTFISDTSIRIG
ncbi:MAG: ubiquinol-cytochrome c reductase iron-sulfur subunit [Proteobacteria bacterium]|nr:ubiquinol-cytochrome c reductase iron-sulfur subunit [Pseudomonadota bacterium]